MSKSLSGVSRRDVIKTVAGVSFFPTVAFSKSSQKRESAKVVIVGGGYGGITAAKYLKKENPNLSVILVEERPFFMSCPLSNHFLAGLMELTPLCFAYNVLEVKHGVKIIRDKVLAVELDKRAVRTSQGYIHYDFLILSPGIDYDIEDKPFYIETLVYYPPAFKPGSEHIYLKRLLSEFEGGDIVITVPPPPYRCPPAPYERAALIADMIKRNKLKAHLYFIDANERPLINSEGFMSAYYDLYKDVATYITSAEVKDVDVRKRIVKTSHGDFRFDIANIIPPTFFIDEKQRGKDRSRIGTFLLLLLFWRLWSFHYFVFSKHFRYSVCYLNYYISCHHIKGKVLAYTPTSSTKGTTTSTSTK
jgi:NADPH-dependent 2,4-dienoyl-CoA reductase/sulfur reductase-like enzyme